jgi:hypothetical protein
MHDVQHAGSRLNKIFVVFERFGAQQAERRDPPPDEEQRRWIAVCIALKEVASIAARESGYADTDRAARALAGSRVRFSSRWNVLGRTKRCVAGTEQHPRISQGASHVRSENGRDESGTRPETAAPDAATSRGRALRNGALRSIGACASLALALGFMPAAHADLVVPSGGQYSTGGGQTDLGCTDVVVAGKLLVAGGSLVNVRNLTIQPGGAIDGGSGEIQLGGNWSNGGTFAAGTSTVRFIDSCGVTTGAVGGNTAFFNARFISAGGKNYVFQVGTTQTIAGVLEIVGSGGKPIQLRSSTPGQVANINLLASGTQSILHVGVTDVWATGQHLAPNQTNEGGGGNAANWFGSGPPPDGGGGLARIPTLGDLALLALAALLAGVAIIDLRRRRPTRSKGTDSRRPNSRNLP